MRERTGRCVLSFVIDFSSITFQGLTPRTHRMPRRFKMNYTRIGTCSMRASVTLPIPSPVSPTRRVYSIPKTIQDGQTLLVFRKPEALCISSRQC